MTSQERDINLTPFEQAQVSVAEFGENCVQSSMWFSMAERLAELEGKDDPQSIADRLIIESFLSSSVATIPGLAQGEA
tara:strand:+ start:1027 stop:1260 length:234 start_codon:yes stop_codon:yes gene_type:complete